MKAVLCFREKMLTAGEIMSEEKVRREEFKVSGEDLVDKIKELVHEGNIRRILIKDKDDRILLDIPLTFGVLGVLVAPQLAALGALAALVGNATIVVEIAE
jgi:CBS domain-containing protein